MLHVPTAARLANRMHRQLGVSQVQRPDAQLGAKHRPNRASAGRIVAHDKHLQRHFGLLGHLLQQHDARRVGCVPLVGVDLDHGALVHLGPVVGLVLARVVGVHGVGHVGGDQEGGGEGLLEGCFGDGRCFGRVRVEGGDHRQAAQDGWQKIGVGAVRGERADFFVVEARDEADRGVVFQSGGSLNGVDETHDGAVRHVEVVEAGREDELVVETAQARELRIVQDQLEVNDVRDGRDVGGGGDDGEELRVVAVRHGLERLEVSLSLGFAGRALGGGLGGLVELLLHQTEDGQQLILLVRVEIGLAMQVDGESGNAKDGLVDLDQLLDKVAVGVLDEHAAGDAEVAVEPGVPKTAAVELDADLLEPVGALLAGGLDAQAGGVGMGADHADGVARLPLATDGEGDDGGAIACQVVLATRLDDRGPVVALADELEAGLLKEGDRGGYSMVGCSERVRGSRWLAHELLTTLDSQSQSNWIVNNN